MWLLQNRAISNTFPSLLIKRNHEWKSSFKITIPSVLTSPKSFAKFSLKFFNFFRVFQCFQFSPTANYVAQQSNTSVPVRWMWNAWYPKRNWETFFSFTSQWSHAYSFRNCFTLIGWTLIVNCFTLIGRIVVMWLLSREITKWRELKLSGKMTRNFIWDIIAQSIPRGHSAFFHSPVPVDILPVHVSARVNRPFAAGQKTLWI